MRSPYGLELVEDCQTCTSKLEGFFCDLSREGLKAFEAIKYTTAYPSGAVLFVEGQTAQGVFLLCKGRIKLSMTSSEGKTLILRIVKPGEMLGLHATVSDTAFQATAETLEPCQVNFIKRDDFLQLLPHGIGQRRALHQPLGVDGRFEGEALFHARAQGIEIPILGVPAFGAGCVEQLGQDFL